MLSSTGALDQRSNSYQFDSGQCLVHDTGYGGFSTIRSESANAAVMTQDPSGGVGADMLSFRGDSINPNEILQTVLTGIFQLLNTLLSALGLGGEPDDIDGGTREPPGRIPPDAQPLGAPQTEGTNSTARELHSDIGESPESGGSFLEQIPDYVEKGKELWEDGKEVYNQVSDYTSKAWDRVADWADSTWDNAKDWGSAVWDGAKAVYSTATDWAASIWSWFV